MTRIFLYFILLLVSSSIFAAGHKSHQGSTAVPQPSTCVKGTFSQTGNQWWSNVSLKITNTCGQDVDLQNSTITFNSTVNINTNFWGEFGPISYPDNNLQITSQQISANNFLASLSLHIPENEWSNSILPNGQSITILYGIGQDVSKPTYNPTSVKVYIDGTPVQTGQIDLTNITAQPAGVTQAYALVDIVNNGQLISKEQVPWSGVKQVLGLAPGTYQLQPLNVSDNQGGSYQGTAAPSSVVVSANQTASSTISYAKIAQQGKINIKTPALPAALSGYTGTPSVSLKRQDTGATVTQNVPWNATTTVSSLANSVSYTFTTPVISFNGNNCTGSFVPATATSNAQTPPTVQLSYSCVPIKIDQVPLNVSGLPSSTSSITVTLTPSDGTTPVTKVVPISNGSGSATVGLTDGMVYNVSASPVSGYTALFNPQPLTATSTATENITYQQASAGRVIGYVPGWKTPPTPAQLASAGYTHMMIAFGVFSTTTPGQIVNAFDTVTKSYIDGLHNVGIKAILSLGGALTSLPNTSVDFHQVLQAASSPTAFQQTFVQSVKTFVSQYGFDGIDIDIEHGFNVAPRGTFSQPTGDIAVMANILKQLHAEIPNFLITLTPQTANMSATRSFDQTWGNYAALIMQTYDVISWVGIQLYNTGCTLGIDNVCYANTGTSPDYSVAMAVDLLESWPAVDSQNRATGFLPYISHLTPSQVVLGYPAPNASGASDGSPTTSIANIKRAIQCLRTGVAGSTSCAGYVPPKAYGSIGGVFNWEVTYDQNNNFAFANGLKTCAKGGSCN